MTRLTDPTSALSVLQQRLLYVERRPERSWTILTENVPVWSVNPLQGVAANPERTSAYGPANGYSELIEAICRREHDYFGLQVKPSQVLVTNGALHGLGLVFRHLYRPGATALCQAPMLGIIARMLQQYGYSTDFFETSPPFDVEKLQAQCTPDTRVIYICSPNNPTGSVLSPDQMSQLVKFARDRSIALVADMVYDRYVFDGIPHCSPLCFEEDASGLYLVNSMSKNYGAPGLRLGWVLSASANILALTGLLEQDCIAVNGMAQHHAQHLLANGAHELVDTVNRGRALIERRLLDMGDLRTVRPQGGTQLLVELPVSDVEAFADFAMSACGLVLTTTSNYVGLTGPYVRLPMGYPAHVIDRGLAALAMGLDQYRHQAESLQGHSAR